MSKRQSIDGYFRKTTNNNNTSIEGRDNAKNRISSPRESLARRVTDDVQQSVPNSIGNSRKRPRSGLSTSETKTPAKPSTTILNIDSKSDDDDEYNDKFWDPIIKTMDETPFKIASGKQSASISATKDERNASGFRPPSTTVSPFSNNPTLGVGHQNNIPVANTSFDDEFSGLCDEDFLAIPDPTINPDTVSRPVDTMQQQSPEKSSRTYDRESNAQHGNETRGFKRHEGENEYDDDIDDEQIERLTLDELTQEHINFDTMYEPGDTDDIMEDTEVIVVEESEVGREVDLMMDHNDEPKALRQPTMSQYFSRDETPAKPVPMVSNFVEFNNLHFMKGNIWKLKNIDKNECSNLIVQIEGFSTERVRGSKRREKVARVKCKYHLPIESLTCISKDGAKNFINNRERKGIPHSSYVECELHSNASVPRFPLSMFDPDGYIHGPIDPDLIFGFEKHGKTETKAGCFFKYNPEKLSPRKRPFIPKNKEGKFTVLDLYAGAGGFSLGLKEAGFKVSHHVDNDTASCSTIQGNFQNSEVLQCSVKDFLEGCRRSPRSSRYPRKGSLTLIHGSSPCQGFSSANRNGGANDDANNAETSKFMDVVEHFQPPFVTFENVVGIAKGKHERYLHKMNERFLMMGYQIRENFLTASDYGDPQNRMRFIIFAAKKGLELPKLPKPTHGDCPSLQPRRSVKDALGFLENVAPLTFEGEVEAEYNGVSVYLQGHRLKLSEPSKDDIHLVADCSAQTVIKKRVIRHYQNDNRPLTRLERAQLQSFPPTYRFYGTDNEIRDQIGNAVPVCLARAIGESVMEAIRKSGGMGYL